MNLQHSKPEEQQWWQQTLQLSPVLPGKWNFGNPHKKSPIIQLVRGLTIQRVQEREFSPLSESSSAWQWLESSAWQWVEASWRKMWRAAALHSSLILSPFSGSPFHKMFSEFWVVPSLNKHQGWAPYMDRVKLLQLNQLHLEHFQPGLL